MNKRIFFKGYYGFQNIGDDLFVKTAEYLSQRMLNAQPCFVGQRLPDLCADSRGITVKSRRAGQLCEIVCALHSDAVIIFGGSTIRRVGSMGKLYGWLYHFPKLNAKTAAIGTSICVEAGDSQLPRFLNRMLLTAVRDERSLQELEACGVRARLSFDPVILLPEVFPKLRMVQREDNVLGLCPCVNRQASEESVRELYLRILTAAVPQCGFRKVKVFQFNGKAAEDLALCHGLCRQMVQLGLETEFVPYSSDTEHFCAEFCSCQMIFGSRLHSGIMAYALEIPFLLEEYHEKCSDFLDTIHHSQRILQEDLEVSKDSFVKVWQEKCNAGILPPSTFEKTFRETIQCLSDRL